MMAELAGEESAHVPVADVKPRMDFRRDLILVQKVRQREFNTRELQPRMSALHQLAHQFIIEVFMKYDYWIAELIIEVPVEASKAALEQRDVPRSGASKVDDRGAALRSAIGQPYFLATHRRLQSVIGTYSALAASNPSVTPTHGRCGIARPPANAPTNCAKPRTN